MQLRCSAVSGWRAGVAQATHSLRHGVLATHPRHTCHWAAHVVNSSGSGTVSVSNSPSSSSSSSSSSPLDMSACIKVSTRGTSSREQLPGASARRRNAWTPDQVAQSRAAMAALGGPYEATSTRMLARMPDAGLNVQQLDGYLHRLRARLPAAGDSEDAAGEGLRPPRMTGDQVGQFECAVTALGGPRAATTSRLMAQLPRAGLNSLRVSSRLHHLRRLMRVHGMSAVEAMERMREDHRVWTPDVQQRVDAAVRALGGPLWATARHILELEPDAGVTLVQLHTYLGNERAKLLGGASGSDDGGDGGGGDGDGASCGGSARADAPMSLHTAQDGGPATPLRPPAAVGGGPPRGWTPEQSRHFLQAVHDLGGSAEATCTAVSDLVRQRLPDGFLRRDQVYYGLQRLREALARTPAAAAAQGRGMEAAPIMPDSRESEDIAVAGLWVKDEVRLMWSPELFDCLEAAVSQLGGLELAKPLAMVPLMGRFNLTKNQVASALQKLRTRARTAARAVAGGAAPRQMLFLRGGSKKRATGEGLLHTATFTQDGATTSTNGRDAATAPSELD